MLLHDHWPELQPGPLFWSSIWPAECQGHVIALPLLSAADELKHAMLSCEHTCFPAKHTGYSYEP